MLVSSHAVADLEGLATRIAVLREGELVAFDTPSDAARRRPGADELDAPSIELLASEEAA